MDVKPVSRNSLYKDIVLQIRSMIDRGELRVGDRLPPERGLAEMFSVSRNSVREAIKTLAEQGVIESRQGAGTFVCEVVEAGDIGPFAGVVLPDQLRLKDVFEVRKLIEPEIAALAARNASPRDISMLESVLVEQEEAVARGVYGRKHDQRLHSVLAEASGNDVLRVMVTALHTDFTETRIEALQSAERQQASLVAHKAIVEAVKHGHVMQAEKAMREHLDEIEMIVFAGNK